VNYTGSLGFGDKHVRVLQGQCGSLDVVDCYETFQYLVKEGIAQEGPGKVFVSGGSHGGFLAGHREWSSFLFIQTRLSVCFQLLDNIHHYSRLLH